MGVRILKIVVGDKPTKHLTLLSKLKLTHFPVPLARSSHSATATCTWHSVRMEPWAAVAHDYDPSLEWPGLNVEPQSRSLSPTLNLRACFRLVVKSSAVVARKRRVAVLDAYEEVQIGRDASSSEDIPRIRLKDMEVSKLHATLFWDRERKEWAIVDMGSKHGTFLRSSASKSAVNTGEGGTAVRDLDAAASNTSFARLSVERQASKPRELHHSDEISIGRTIFIVHVHPDALPCGECRSEGEFDIPLFSKSSSSKGEQSKASVEIAEVRTKAPQLDAKTAMTLLKRSLLSRHSDAPSETLERAGASHQYIDRSAKRRTLYPYSRPSSPPPSRGVRFAPFPASVPPAGTGTSKTPGILSSEPSCLVNNISRTSTLSAPPAPISDMNVGHRLLEKQGWVPGSALGVPVPLSAVISDVDGRRALDKRTALLEPLHISANTGRRGLGMRPDSSTSRENGAKVPERICMTEWKLDCQKRRWDEISYNGV